MPEEISSLELDVGEPKGETIPGDVTGEIAGLERYTHNEYGDSLAVKLETEKTGLEFRGFYNLPEKITENHDLGKLLERFGATLTPDESVNVIDYLNTGTKVQFYVEEEEGEDDTSWEVDTDTIRPVGQDAPETEQENLDDATQELEARVRSVLEQVGAGASEPAIYGALAELDGEAVEAYEEAKESGLVTLNGGELEDWG